MSADDSDTGGSMPIRAKVAKILNITDLVLNRGASQGVHVGMEFVILNRYASDITDPETKQVIGSVPVAKTIVKVVNVQEEMAIARTFRKSEGGGLTTAIALSSVFGGPRRETLRTSESTAVQELDEKDSFVKGGDDAVEVTDSSEYLLPPF